MTITTSYIPMRLSEPIVSEYWPHLRDVVDSWEAIIEYNNGRPQPIVVIANSICAN